MIRIISNSITLAELKQEAQTDLWGINLYPSPHGTADWLEYDSMINFRPSIVSIDHLLNKWDTCMFLTMNANLPLKV